MADAGDVAGGVPERLHGLLELAQRRGDALHRILLGATEGLLQCAEAGAGSGDALGQGLLGLGIGGALVTLEQVAQTQQFGLRVGQRLQLGETAAVVFRQQLHAALHGGEQFAELLIFRQHLAPRLVGRGVGGTHAAQRALVVLVIAVLLLQQLDVHRVGEGAEQLLLLL